MKKALVFIVLLALVLTTAMLFVDKKHKAIDDSPYIAVTSFCIYDITKALVKDKVLVKKLIPFGVEMHSYMPSVQTMAEIVEAELFIYNGLGIEPWIKKEYDNQLRISDYVALIHAEEIHAEEEEEGHEHHQHEGEFDPHYWLDIDNMIIMTNTIKDQLIVHFPKYASMFSTNAETYIRELKALDEMYKNRLKNCSHDEIIVNHNAFGYLSQRYGFHSHSVMGLSPDEQASAKKMKEITDLVKEENIKTIFFERFVSPVIAETISKETGAQVESLQPLANISNEDKTKSYAELMQENLLKLHEAMECQ